MKTDRTFVTISILLDMAPKFNPVSTSEPPETLSRSNERDTCATNIWGLVYFCLAIGTGILGLTLLIISIHIQTENDIDGIHRAGTVVMSICAIGYFVQTALSIIVRRKTYVPVYILIYIAAIVMVQILVFGIAKGHLSKFFAYNFMIGMIAALAALIVIGLGVIHYFWATDKT